MNSDDAKNFFLPGISYEDFIDKDILELMGANNMPADQKGRIYETIIETIQDRVVLKILGLLSDEDYNRLTKALDEKDEKTFEQIVNENKIDLARLFGEEAVLYKMELVNLANNTKE